MLLVDSLKKVLFYQSKCFKNIRLLSDSAQFGFKKVKTEEKQTKVNEVFTNVAKKYDLMNDTMSFGLHRIWKDQFIHELAPTMNMRLIDVAGGTGDIAFRYLHYLKNLYKSEYENCADRTNLVTICDINADMLEVGKERASALGYTNELRFQVGNAENLTSEKDSTYDAYTISFGIRNCTHLDKVVKEAYRVLKPGGRFMCLEFSRVDNEYFRKIYDMYSFQVIPVMGHLIAGDWDSYQYLVESIRVFPNQTDFAKLIEDSGFKSVSYKNLTNGIVAIHSGFKL